MKLITLIKENLIVAIGAAALIVFNMIGVAMYSTYAEPWARELITEVNNDSLAVWTKRVKEKHPSGFRTHLSGITGLSQDVIADSIGSLYNKEENVYMSVQFLLDEHGYTKGGITTLVYMVTEPVTLNGVKFRVTANGGLLYKDDFDKWWKAIYFEDEGAYYFIPDYTSGQRIKCD